MTAIGATSSPAPGNAADDAIDRVSIWLTRLLVFSLPVMLFNPMNPAFHRLQLSEALFAFLFVLTTWRVVRRGEHLAAPSPLGWALIGYVGAVCLSALLGPAPANGAVEAAKTLYLLLLGWTIWHNGTRYRLGEYLAQWLAAAFVLIVGGAVVGGLLLLAGWETFLAHPSRIIGIALGISDVLPIVPRVVSFLKPTGNMLGVYLAVTVLPVMALGLCLPALRGRHGLAAAALFLVALLGLLTMSRAFASVLLAIALGLLVLRWPFPLRRLSGGCALTLAVATFLLLQAFTVFYPVGVAARYTTDPAFEKEIVDLHTKIKPNPVYFLRPGVGLESLELRLDFAFNHYAWLKYAGWEMFVAQPWFGVGPGGFSAGAADLAADGVVDPELADYRSTQSQYATLLAETGIVGTAAFALASLLLVQRLRRAGGRHPLALPALLGLSVAAIVAIDMELLAFRWLWGLYAVALIPWARSALASGGTGMTERE